MRPSEEINFLVLEKCDDQNQIIKPLPIKKSTILSWRFSFNYLQHVQRLEYKQQFNAAYCTEALINSNDNCRACIAILGNNYPAYVGNLLSVKSDGGEKIASEYICSLLALRLC